MEQNANQDRPYYPLPAPTTGAAAPNAPHVDALKACLCLPTCSHYTPQHRPCLSTTSANKHNAHLYLRIRYLQQAPTAANSPLEHAAPPSATTQSFENNGNRQHSYQHPYYVEAQCNDYHIKKSGRDPLTRHTIHPLPSCNRSSDMNEHAVQTLTVLTYTQHLIQPVLESYLESTLFVATIKKRSSMWMLAPLKNLIRLHSQSSLQQ